MSKVRVVLVALLVIFSVGVSYPAQADTVTQQTQVQTYTVQPGNTLFQIALRYNVTVEQLVSLNNLADPSHILVGQVLRIPGPAEQSNAPVSMNNPVVQSAPVYYVVQPGDTLNRIAKSYGVSYAAIVSANNIANGDHIEVGQSLIVPGLSAPGSGATIPQQPAIPPTTEPAATVAVPTVLPTLAPTAIPPTVIPPTTVPPTAVPPTAIPPTAVPPTAVPPTAVPATAIPTTVILPSATLPATVQPSVVPTSVTPTIAPAALRTYTVQSGEGLSQIARRYNVTWPQIAALNNISDPNTIFAGTILRIPASDTNPPTTMESSVGVPPGPVNSSTSGKSITVVLHEERVYVYQDGVLIRNVLVSTGLPDTPTVMGTYHIYVKIPSQLMTGPGYYLPGVPWVMYFYEGYSFHGTYWHHNWGHPMSHGCVNMPTDEALWLYNWAEVGTPVTVIW